MKHPIRDLEIRTYSNPDYGWVAQFGDGRAFPIIFRGESEAEVDSKASGFRYDVVKKYEAAYIARKKQGEQAKARAAAKKAAKAIA